MINCKFTINLFHNVANNDNNLLIDWCSDINKNNKISREDLKSVYLIILKFSSFQLAKVFIKGQN